MGKSVTILTWTNTFRTKHKDGTFSSDILNANFMQFTFMLAFIIQLLCLKHKIFTENSTVCLFMYLGASDVQTDCVIKNM